MVFKEVPRGFELDRTRTNPFTCDRCPMSGQGKQNMFYRTQEGWAPHLEHLEHYSLAPYPAELTTVKRVSVFGSKRLCKPVKSSLFSRKTADQFVAPLDNFPYTRQPS